MTAPYICTRKAMTSQGADFTNQNSHPLCHPCGREEEDVVHFTTRCMAVSSVIKDNVLELQEMYREDIQDPLLRLPVESYRYAERLRL